MPKIVIIEYDETTPGVISESNVVVYVPGCVDTSQASLIEDGVYVGIQPNEPTLFTSVNDFEALCGAKGLRFERDWDYRELTYTDANGATLQAFPAEATPYSQKMFNKGTVDPGYVLAKELLAAGLNVLFERINVDSTFEVLRVAGETFTADDKDKFADIPLITGIADTTAPNTLVTEDGARTIYIMKRDSEVGIGVDDPTKTLAASQFGESSATTVSGYIDADLITTRYTYGTNANSDGVGTSVANGDAYNDKLVYVVLKEGVNDADKALDSSYVLLDLSDKDSEHYNYLTIAADGKSATFKEEAEGRVFTRNLLTLYADTNIEIELIEGAETYYNGKLYKFGTINECYKFTFKTESATTYRPEKWITDYYSSKYIEIVPLAENEYLPVPGFNITVPEGTTNIAAPVKGVQLDRVYDALTLCYSGEFDEDTGFTSGLADKGNFNIKYITSGGYPVYEYAGNSVMTKMLALARTRGDCYALIDHTDNAGRTTDINKKASVWKKLQQNEVSDGEYGAMFTPWATYARTTVDRDNGRVDKTVPQTIRMPASYAYLQALADSLNTNAPWLAVAGAARGSVKYLADGGMTTVISNGVADAMQPRTNGTSVNAITNIKPYGQTIWGNRTLKWNEENLIATSFLNIRNLVCDVKKEAYKAARALTFEQDNEVLWINFKSKVAPTLDRMLSGYGISGYKIIRNTEHAKARENATVCARIILYPTYAVEDFYIDIVLKDSEVTVESNG